MNTPTESRTSGPTTLTLAAALKAKRRIICEIQRLAQFVQTHNRQLSSDKDVYAVADAFKKYDRLSVCLVQIRVAIGTANTNPTANGDCILGRLAEQTEIKSKIAMLQRVDTNRNIGRYELDSSTDQPDVFVTLAIAQPAIDAMLRNLQSRFDELQDQIDGLNHSTTILLDFAPEIEISQGV